MNNALLKISLSISLIITLSLPCYSSTGIESNLEDWGENQNKWDGLIRYYAYYYNISPFDIKAIIGQENRGFQPGLPQGWKSIETQGKGPGRGLGQIESELSEGGKKVRTYESMLLNYGNLKYFREFQQDDHWKNLLKEYNKILPQYDWDHNLAAKSQQGQELIEYGKSKVPLVSREEYKNKIELGGFNEVELEQIASNDIELLAGYYKYILEENGGGKEGHLIQDEIERAGITGLFGYNMGPGNLAILKNAIKVLTN